MKLTKSIAETKGQVICDEKWQNFSDSECDKLHFEHIPQFLTWLASYKLRQIFLFWGGNFLSYYFTVSGGFISPRWFPPSFQRIMVNKNMILFFFQVVELWS